MNKLLFTRPSRQLFTPPPPKPQTFISSVSESNKSDMMFRPEDLGGVGGFIPEQTSPSLALDVGQVLDQMQVASCNIQ